jgi:ATPase subunit of ABC transporter with duplicated ATPase domains
MSASITLAGLSWSTPDGRPLFSNLDLSFAAGRTGLVGRNGVGKTTLLRLLSGELQPLAGSVTSKGRLGILRQSIQVGSGDTLAGLFGIADHLAILRRAESGKAGAEELARIDWTIEGRLATCLGRLGLAELQPATPLMALSGGQRTRAALAALVFTEPDFLLLDEPTNNLDREGREAVVDLLAGWRAGAIVVSHDRELLEAMDAIVELTSLGATRYGGGWSHYRQQKDIALVAARHDLAAAEKRIADIDRRTQATAERQARKDGAGKRRRERGDIPRIQLNALKNRSETTGGTNARLAERRRAQASAEADAARDRIEVLQPLSVASPSTGLPANKIVLRFESVSFSHQPDRELIDDLSFDVVGPERVAVVGSNGSGKTTLLGLVEGRLTPQRGRVEVMTDLAVLDQQVGLLDPARSIHDNFRRLNPHAAENACRAALARFMFRAEAALQIVSSLSGGQLLRAGLACVLGVRPPSLLILDEPTNHLDLDSIEAVEAGLRAYDGALLVVSHDEVFLESIGITRRIELTG